MERSLMQMKYRAELFNNLGLAMEWARDQGYRHGIRNGLLWALAAVATCGTTVLLLTWWAS